MPDLAPPLPLALDPRTPVIRLVERFGPPAAGGDRAAPIAGSSGQTAAPSEPEAWAYVRGLATAHYENFSVLSSLVPARLRDDFAAIYAFCRWSDDLGDETGAGPEARARAAELLTWWRAELDRCF
ncbi:MAG: squalene/phytoene synthase family protein, partial [Phycisphaerales bacterium]|nr:squalene/phytoene synthase family protein [Phycisphaerales bacterium]